MRTNRLRGTTPGVLLAASLIIMVASVATAQNVVAIGRDGIEPGPGAWDLTERAFTVETADAPAWLAIQRDADDFSFSTEFRAEGAATIEILARAHHLPVLPVQEGAAMDALPKQWYGYAVQIPVGVDGNLGAIRVRHDEEALLVEGSPDIQDALVDGEWNRVDVRALGPVIEVYINRKLAARAHDERFIAGRVALRVTPSGSAPAAVAFRNLGFTYEGPFAPDAIRAQWRPLFNGVDLSGWKNWGDEEFVVEDGVIVGRSGPKKSEGYLCTEERWTDFRVRGWFQMLGAGNFGLFYHSNITLREDGYPIISGVQGEVAPDYPSPSGCHYESYRRGWIVPPDTQSVGAWALRPLDEWSYIEIRAVGNRITSWVNGVLVNDFHDAQHQVFEGGFALQLHAGGVDGIAWRDIEVRDPFIP